MLYQQLIIDAVVLDEDGFLWRRRKNLKDKFKILFQLPYRLAPSIHAVPNCQRCCAPGKRDADDERKLHRVRSPAALKLLGYSTPANRVHVSDYACRRGDVRNLKNVEYELSVEQK